jgi:hypothetical protein
MHGTRTNLPLARILAKNGEHSEAMKGENRSPEQLESWNVSKKESAIAQYPLGLGNRKNTIEWD